MIEELKEMTNDSIAQTCEELCPTIEDCFLQSCPLNTILHNVDKYVDIENGTMLIGAMIAADELKIMLSNNDISEVNEWNL